MATNIQLRRGTAAEWTAANPTLMSGELGLETDTTYYKIGNGSTAWNSLAYGSFNGVIETGTITSAMILDGTIVNGDINASAAIALSKLASGSSAQIIVANSSGVPTYVTLSGDATISNTGVLTLANSSLSLDEISDVVITDASSTQLLQYNGTNWVNATVSTTPTWDDDQNILSNQVFG